MRLLYDCAGQLQRGNFRLAFAHFHRPVLNLDSPKTFIKIPSNLMYRRSEGYPAQMLKIFQALLAGAFFCGFLTFSGDACLAQSTINSPAVDEVQLSISLTNNVIPVGSTFSITAEMRNPSTNVIYINESTPEQDFTVFLTSASGTVYQISPSPRHKTGVTVRNLIPGAKDDWIINAWISRYFEPPGYTPTHKNVPAGNYTLKVTTKIATQYKVFKAESNVVEIQIK